MKRNANIVPKTNWGPNYSIPPRGYFHFGVEIPIADNNNANVNANPQPTPAPIDFIKQSMPAPNNKPNNRFAAVGDEDVEDISKNKKSASTNQSTTFAVKVLKTFFSETGQRFPDTEMDNEQLSILLSIFYIAARKEDGVRYKVITLKRLRFSLQRYFLEDRKVDIIEDMCFKSANITFENVLKLTKAEGLGNTEHHPKVEPEDLLKLYSSIDINNPTGLQELVWFNIMYYMCRRGRQNLRQMKKSSYAVGTDANGVRYIYQLKGEADKNHNETDGNNETTGEGVIYETGSEKCLLNPHLDDLWQRPRPSISVCDRIWYCNAPLGAKTLGNMLAKLSTKYNLSRRYTNHSLRVTSMQVMEDGNVGDRHIQRVSGHKSLDSISNCARRLSTARKRKISSILSNGVGETIQTAEQPKHQQPSGVTEPQNKQTFAQASPQIFSAKSSDKNFCNIEILPDDPEGDELFSSLPRELIVSHPTPKRKKPTTSTS